MRDPLKFSWKPEIKEPSLIVGWGADASKLGTGVTDYLIKKLGGTGFCEIEPVEFFPLGGVTIDDNLVQFPESKFFACLNGNLIVLKSDPPGNEWYKFLNLVLDVAEQFHVKEIHAIGGIVSLSAHTAPRGLLGTFNSPDLKSALTGYGLSADWDYESPSGQRPTLNSFLLWSARRRNMSGTILWASIPFYLSATDDPQSRWKILDFFNRRFTLGVDLSDVDGETKRQDEIIAGLRSRLPEIDKSIKKLENNLTLSDEESQELIKEIETALKRKPLS